MIKTKLFIKDFFKCGLTGWCMEIIFTSLHALQKRDMTLKGVTSIWMFPIYGLAAVIRPISQKMGHVPTLFRGLSYMIMIFSVEFMSGRFLMRHKMCPWDYSQCRYHIGKVIRLDFAPYWFGAGLLFEHLLKKDSSRKNALQ